MLNSEASTLRPLPTGEIVLAAHHVSFSYGAERVLDDVSLEVRAGEFAALAGPNGSGKSTLLRVLLGLAPPNAGTVQTFGVAPGSLRDRWRVGYVPQRSRIGTELPATVEEVVATGRLRGSAGGAACGPPTAPPSTMRSSRSRSPPNGGGA